MHTVFICPQERVPLDLEIKRALMTHDNVVLNDPSDRDFLPSATFDFAQSMGINLPFSMPGPPVNIRPLAKLTSYDRKFDQLLQRIKPAISSNNINVERCWDEKLESFIIFYAGNDIVPDQKICEAVYVAMSANPEFLRSAVAGDTFLSDIGIEKTSQLANEFSLIDVSHQANFEEASVAAFGEAEIAKIYGSIARARIASLIKSIMFCSRRKYVPLTSGKFQGRLLNKIIQAASISHESGSVGAIHSARISRALQLVNEEYVDENVLNLMPIESVLRMRTIAWGKYYENRNGLLSSLNNLVSEDVSSQELDKFVAAKIFEFQDLAREVEDERKKVRFKSAASLFRPEFYSLLGAGVTVAGIGFLSQAAVSGASLLALAGLHAANVFFEDKAGLVDILTREEKLKEHFVFGINQFYSNVDSSVRTNKFL